VSLGKPSLRLRLEAYYSLISPDVIADGAAWRKRFGQIYDKYGGTAGGERALANKLAKKYGGRVRLLLTTAAAGQRHGGGGGDSVDGGGSAGRAAKREEAWYDPTPSGLNSGVLSFTSADFDPVAALAAEVPAVVRANPHVGEAPLLDDTSKFRRFLPSEDPQRMVPPRSTAVANAHGYAPIKPAAAASAKAPRLSIPGAFSALADRFDSGPFSLLQSIHSNRQRVRVMVRYVDCVRGTLTGYLLAFDKHLNMILRDVDEVYSGRATKSAAFGHGGGGGGKGQGEAGSGDSHDGGSKPSNLEVEVKRRKFRTGGVKSGSGSGSGGGAKWGVPLKRRHLHQVLVRGDNVVVVWRADEERSAWPPARGGSPRVASIYVQDGAKKGGGPGAGGSGANAARVPSAGYLMESLEWERDRDRDRDRDGKGKRPAGGGGG
jgi:small nuclear ribonucleoprotein (snRNP)-like protein